jgi:hypothetical protein
MSLAAISVFKFAIVSTEKKLYDVQVQPDRGGPIATAIGTNLDTAPIGNVHLDTLIIDGNTRVAGERRKPRSGRLRRTGSEQRGLANSFQGNYNA